MKKILLSIFIICWATLGFTQTDSIKRFRPEIEVFEFTTDTQTATFYIDVFWTGISSGGMPILNLSKWRPKKLNDMDIYFDPAYSEKVKEKLPGSWKGRPEIIIKAKIYLKRKEVNVSSNPPRTLMIYQANVVELYDITVNTIPPTD